MYKVYYTDAHGCVGSETFGDEFMVVALQKAEEFRKLGFTFVTMVSGGLPGQVGAAGVDSVVDGKLPNGERYTWMKRRSM